MASRFALLILFTCVQLVCVTVGTGTTHGYGKVVRVNPVPKGASELIYESFVIYSIEFAFFPDFATPSPTTS